ncbi:MAG: TlpA family protein disulfide reductase [Myxococcales bacterium]|nr:TlpA family protein disulfide reductase [Myxococcales bacterium]
MPLPRIARNVALAVARMVGHDDLFEKPGERARTPSLAPPRPEPAAIATAATPTTAKPKRAPAKAIPSEKTAIALLDPPRPTSGCRPVDLVGLRRALAPTGKPLVINHWASWCDPCVDELPRLVRAAAGVADIGEFMGLSWDLFDHPGDPHVVAKKVAAFADSVGVGYASVLFVGEPAELFAALGLDSELIPQTVVYAPDGTVAWKKVGVLEHDDVFPLIRAVKAAAGVA